MLLCVDAAWAKRMSLSLKLSSHWRPCKLPRTGKKGKKKEVTKLTMKVITRCIRALRRYQKTKNKTNVTEFETGDSLSVTRTLGPERQFLQEFLYAKGRNRERHLLRIDVNTEANHFSGWRRILIR